MMSKYTPLEIVLNFVKTALLLVALEILSTAFLPAIGIINFRPAFNVLIVLYLAFKLDIPVLPILILLTQFVHSVFSIEGWAVGTITGVMIAVSVRFLKDLLSFSTPISTIVVVQMFQLGWFVIKSFLLCLKFETFEPFFSLVWKQTPESFLLSLSAPYFFILLDAFWRPGQSTLGAR